MRRPPLTRAEIEHISEVRHRIAQEVVKVNRRRRRIERVEWWRARLKPVTNNITFWILVLTLTLLATRVPVIEDGAEVVAADVQAYEEAALAERSPEALP